LTTSTSLTSTAGTFVGTPGGWGARTTLATDAIPAVERSSRARPSWARQPWCGRGYGRIARGVKDAGDAVSARRWVRDSQLTGLLEYGLRSDGGLLDRADAQTSPGGAWFAADVHRPHQRGRGPRASKRRWPPGRHSMHDHRRGTYSSPLMHTGRIGMGSAAPGGRPPHWRERRPRLPDFAPLAIAVARLRPIGDRRRQTSSHWRWPSRDGRLMRPECITWEHDARRGDLCIRARTRPQSSDAAGRGMRRCARCWTGAMGRWRPARYDVFRHNL